MDIMQQLQLGKFLSPEDAQMYDPLIQMLAKGGQATPAGERRTTSTDREIARANESRKKGGTQWDNGKASFEPQQVSGGGSGQAKHDPFDMAAIFAEMGDPRAIKALGMGATDWSRTPTPGVNPVASAFSQSGNRSGALGDRAASRRVTMAPATRGGFGNNIKPYDSTANYEYMDRQRELRYRNEDARFEDRRRRDLLNMILGVTGGNLNEQRITEGDQYVNSAGAWKRMPTREVETKTISPLDILRMLGG